MSCFNDFYKVDNTIIFKLPYKDLNNKTSKDFKYRLLEVITNSTGNVIVLDFSKIRLIDNQGLGILIKTWSMCSKKGIELIICGLNDIIELYLKKRGLDKIVTIFNTLGQAISYAQNSTLNRINQYSQSINLEYLFGNPVSKPVLYYAV